MADNTQLSTGTGGDTIRDKDRAGVKTQIVGLDLNPAGAEVLGTGDATNGLDVDVTRVQGTVTVSGMVGLAAGANNIGDVDIASAVFANADGSGTMPSAVVVVAGNDGTNTQALKTDVNGLLQVVQNGTVTVSGTVTANAGTGTLGTNLAQVAGTTTDTNSGNKSAGTQRVVLATDQPQLTNALKVDGSAVTQPVSGTVTANPAAVTSGGASPSVTISAASTNGTNVKGSAGQVYALYATNTNAAVRYLKLYDKATTPTVGTDTPVLVFAIPGNTAGAGFAINFGVGIAFANGIGFGLTTGVANNDTGAVAASELVVNVVYK